MDILDIDELTDKQTIFCTNKV